MNSNNSYSRERFKLCAGKSCDNFAKVWLKINYIDKIGGFCESCAGDLVHDELAIIVGE
jgi:hypothetical protein